MVSLDIQQNADNYREIIRAHAAMPPADIARSLRETQDELLATLAGSTDAGARRTPAPGDWGLRDLALHAAFSERLIASIIHHASRSVRVPAADLEGAAIGMMPADDGRSYEHVLEDLRARNADLLRAVEWLPAQPDVEMRLPHPFFGPLNCLEWAGFQRVHDLDHIQHAHKILATLAT